MQATTFSAEEMENQWERHGGPISQIKSCVLYTFKNANSRSRKEEVPNSRLKDYLPSDALLSSSYFQYIQEVVHECQSQMGEGASNRYHQSRL